MDYKELIENLKKVTAGLQEDDAPKCAAVCEEAANTIETLLAEREAAMEDLRGRCDICKHRRVCLFDKQHRIGCANSKRGHWQWRGPTPHDRQQAER